MFGLTILTRFVVTVKRHWYLLMKIRAAFEPYDRLHGNHEMAPMRFTDITAMRSSRVLGWHPDCFHTDDINGVIWVLCCISADRRSTSLPLHDRHIIDRNVRCDTQRWSRCSLFAGGVNTGPFRGSRASSYRI